MSATMWRGDDGDTPRVTGRLLRWYRLRLPAVFCVRQGDKREPMEPGQLADLVAWYTERPEDFLVWKADEEFRGGTYRMGAWRLNIAAINEALPRASREIEAEKRRLAYAHLGPVTDADVDAALARLEGSAPLIQEADGSSLYALNDPRRSACLSAQYRVQDHWPRDCRRCGQEFRPGCRQRRTCGDCLAKAKADREAVREARS